MRSFLTVALLAAAATSAAAARRGGPGTAPPAFGAADPDLVGKAADYAHFSDLIASVMLIREGGVEKAMDAIPSLHDETDAYIKTIALLAANPSDFNASAWKGLSSKSVLKLSGKNWTENDPVANWGTDVTNKLNATGKLDDSSLDPATNVKVNKTMAALNAFADKIGATDDNATIAALNDKLAKFNIEVTGKSIAQPSKFSNEAAAIARSITGISLGATAVEFAPCLISYGVSGVSFAGTGVNVAPVGLQMSAVASTVSVQGANIQPSLILVQPIGSNVQPQGFQVAPFLIAVSPLGSNVQPQGLNVGPTGIAVAPTGKSIAPVGKATTPVDIAYAPVDIDLNPDEGDAGAEGAPPSGDASPDQDIPPVSVGRRRLASWLNPGKVNIMPDPLDLSNEFPHDYRNWAAVLSQVLLKKEGAPDAASAALARVMLDAHATLAKASDGEPFVPRFHLTDPVLLGDGGKAKGLPPLEATKFSSGAEFVSFSPCVLSESYTGLDAGLTGLSITPALVSFTAALAANEIVGINLNPNLIFISALGNQVNPQGFNVQPALLYVGPIASNVQPQGGNIAPTLINVAPVGSSVQPVGRLIAPAHKVIAPVHKAFAPVKEDTVDGPNPKIDLAEIVEKEAGRGKPGKAGPGDKKA